MTWDSLSDTLSRYALCKGMGCFVQCNIVPHLLYKVYNVLSLKTSPSCIKLTLRNLPIIMWSSYVFTEIFWRTTSVNNKQYTG